VRYKASVRGTARLTSKDRSILSIYFPLSNLQWKTGRDFIKRRITLSKEPRKEKDGLETKYPERERQIEKETSRRRKTNKKGNYRK
jgi:hypothetical protein